MRIVVRPITVIAWVSVVALMVYGARDELLMLLREHRLPMLSSKKAFNAMRDGLIARGYAVTSGGWDGWSLGQTQIFEGHGRLLRLLWDTRDGEVWIQESGPPWRDLFRCSNRGWRRYEDLVATVLASFDEAMVAKDAM